MPVLFFPPLFQYEERFMSLTFRGIIVGLSSPFQEGGFLGNEVQDGTSDQKVVFICYGILTTVMQLRGKIILYFK